MNALLKKGLVALTLGATLATAATPAEAQRWYGGRGRTVIVRDRGGIGAGGALAVGIAGLAVGAALANRDRYYGPPRGYYGPRYYAPAPYYYGPPRGYYYDGPRCYVERRWDPYWGRPVRVEVCR